ncbi:MAG: alkaline phosphatase family protein [Planctomycetota bacterium]|nr:alkaline phosphatase family protein [Planctomycetota bacterium]
MKKFLAGFALSLALFSWGCASGPGPSSPDGDAAGRQSVQRRVLLVALDGLRSDALLRYAPNLRTLGEKNLATWTSRVAIPISAPSWCTVLSGLSHERTGVTNNAFTGKTLQPSDNRLAQGTEKTLFGHLRESQVVCSVISSGTWDGIEKIAGYQSATPHNRRAISPNNRPHNERASQRKGIAMALEDLASPEIDFVTFYTHHIDNAGHLFGHDPDVFQYASAIQDADADLARLFRAVEERERNHPEEWLVVITTDHGGSSRWKLEKSPEGRKVLATFDADPQIHAGISQRHLEGIHGLRSDDALGHEQTTTFIILKRGDRQGDLGAGRTNRDIAPTILRYLLPGRNDLLEQMDGNSIDLR